jgi:hypothetical protein
MLVLASLRLCVGLSGAAQGRVSDALLCSSFLVRFQVAYCVQVICSGCAGSPAARWRLFSFVVCGNLLR